MKFLSEGLVEQTELIKMPQSPSTEEDKTKEIKRRLEKRGIPADDWQYYVESPHSWDYSKVASSGLSKGVEVVLLSPTTCTPSSVEKGSLSRFIQLRGKLKELMQAKSEIEKFIQSEAPDDNQLLVAYKQAGKKADKLQSELQSACNALESMTIEYDECFGEDFLSSLMEFSLEMAKKKQCTGKSRKSQDSVGRQRYSDASDQHRLRWCGHWTGLAYQFMKWIKSSRAISLDQGASSRL